MLDKMDSTRKPKIEEKDDVQDTNDTNNSNVNYLFGEVTGETIDKLVQWIITENLKPDFKVLTLYINSEGGSLTNAFALIDIMNSSPHVIRTVGIGSVMSAAFLIFAAGSKGERYIGKNTSIMSHQFSDEVAGKYHDIKATMREQDNTNERMTRVLSDATGMDMKTAKAKFLTTSDIYYTAEELIKLKVADFIL